MNNKRCKILIVDDNRIIREVLRGLIRHDETLQVVGVAANGDAALDMIGSLKPDLVCLDVLMPGRDGLDTLRAIRTQFPGTRVILVTGESRLDVVTRALRAGASGFVVKPFNAEKMLRTIHAALKGPLPECQPEPEPAEEPAGEAVGEAAAQDGGAAPAASAAAEAPGEPPPEQQAA